VHAFREHDTTSGCSAVVAHVLWEPPVAAARASGLGLTYGPDVAGTLDQGSHDQEISPDSSAGHVPSAG
jgi:hypothetical protein